MNAEQMMSVSNGLKPCPFCGNPPKYDGVSRYNLTPLAWCDTVGCPLDGDALTISQWNTRAPVRVKLPSRYNDNAGRAITADRHGRWFLAEDVIAALKAQGVEVVE